MNKHIITTLALIAISVPVLTGAQTAPTAAKETGPAKVIPSGKAAPVVAAPAATKGLPEKIIRERVSNVINALQRHAELLTVAISKVSDQSAKFKSMGGDVSKADLDIAAAKVKLDEVHADISNLQDLLKNTDLTNKARTQVIRDGVAKTVDAIRACRTTLVDGIQKLKAVKVTRIAAPTQVPATAAKP